MATLKPTTPLRAPEQQPLKPPSPLLAPNRGALKPASPLHPKNAPKTLISHPQRRWRFQLTLGRRPQRRRRFQTAGPAGLHGLAAAPVGGRRYKRRQSAPKNHYFQRKRHRIDDVCNNTQKIGQKSQRARPLRCPQAAPQRPGTAGVEGTGGTGGHGQASRRGLAAEPVGGGGAWPGFETTRRAEGSRRGRLASRPPPAGASSSPAHETGHMAPGTPAGATSKPSSAGH